MWGERKGNTTPGREPPGLPLTQDEGETAVQGKVSVKCEAP